METKTAATLAFAATGAAAVVGAIVMSRKGQTYVASLERSLLSVFAFHLYVSCCLLIAFCVTFYARNWCCCNGDHVL